MAARIPGLYTESTETWPTQAEAAATLQISTKTIERYAQERKIEMRKRPLPGRKAENVCNPADIQNLLPAPHIMPADDGRSQLTVRRPAPFAPPLMLPNFDAAIERISTILTLKLDSVPIDRKIWLTLDEAGAYSGRTRAWLLRRCQAGEFTAERDGGWKILRHSLECYGAPKKAARA